MERHQILYLEEKYGNRANFNKMERELYGHDIAAIPSLIAPLIGKTIPEAIVQPENEEELINLVKWANQNNIALTPRGKASSGYGGVLPVKQGIVVDFFHLNKVISLNKQE
jgi:FAD/FMN-containing dehydrogenase